MTIVSQRDERWAGIMVGSGDKNIGQAGCTITALGYLVGLTPDKVNAELNRVAGYQVNLVIWAKVAEAIGVTCYRHKGYEDADNDKVAEAIARDGACLGEVDAAAIGGTGKHWVVMTGDHKCQDPWTGTERPTSDFHFTGYTTTSFDRAKMGNYPEIVNGNMYGVPALDLNNAESMKLCVDVYNDVMLIGVYVLKTDADRQAQNAAAEAKERGKTEGFKEGLAKGFEEGKASVVPAAPTEPTVPTPPSTPTPEVDPASLVGDEWKPNGMTIRKWFGDVEKTINYELK